MRRGTLSALAGLLVVAAGCGASEEITATPAACLEGPDPYLKALAAAPEEVLLAGETPISGCLPDEQEAGQIATVGEAMVAAATELNRRARRAPQGEVTVQLGYLVGAVEATAEGTGGIHEDLFLRVESAARFIPKDELVAAAFQQRYEEGLASARAASSSG